MSRGARQDAFKQCRGEGVLVGSLSMQRRARRLYDPELLAFVDLDAELLLRLHREEPRGYQASLRFDGVLTG